jgi:hypothetical protein
MRKILPARCLPDPDASQTALIEKQGFHQSIRDPIAEVQIVETLGRPDALLIDWF